MRWRPEVGTGGIGEDDPSAAGAHSKPFMSFCPRLVSLYCPSDTRPPLKFGTRVTVHVPVQTLLAAMCSAPSEVFHWKLLCRQRGGGGGEWAQEMSPPCSVPSSVRLRSFCTVTWPSPFWSLPTQHWPLGNQFFLGDLPSAWLVFRFICCQPSRSS